MRLPSLGLQTSLCLEVHGSPHIHSGEGHCPFPSTWHKTGLLYPFGKLSWQFQWNTHGQVYGTKILLYVSLHCEHFGYLEYNALFTLVCYRKATGRILSCTLGRGLKFPIRSLFCDGQRRGVILKSQQTGLPSCSCTIQVTDPGFQISWPQNTGCARYLSRFYCMCRFL